MPKTFVYLRGKPGVGKITVARILQGTLGWKLFWFHDLKNAVYEVVQEHRIPHLMSEVTQPVIRYLLNRKEDIIYVRPSPDEKTVEDIREIVAEFPDYRFIVVRLEAPYESLLERVSGRDDPYRISDKASLDSYLSERDMANISHEIVIETAGLTPEEVANKVCKAIED